MSDQWHRHTDRLTETVDDVRRVTSGTRVSVGDIIDATEGRGILPLVLIPAVIAATPLSGIPGLSAVCGLLIALLSFELIFGLRTLLVPDALRDKSIDATRLNTALECIRPTFAWIERHTRPRIPVLFHRPLIWLPQTLCLLTGLAMPFLEIIPFSASVAAIAVCLLTIAMLTKDAVFFAVALMPYVGLGYMGIATIN